MDPTLYPSPPYACTEDLTSGACGAAMLSLCGQATLFNGQTIADLINPSSNCSIWRSAVLVENALAGTLSGGSSFLDQAGASYCADEQNAPECACVMFPNIPASAAWCGHGSTTDCPAPAGQCSLDEIAQSRGDGVVDVLEFPHCTPHFCWLSSCYDSNGLVPTGMIQSQSTLGVCPAWCIQIDSNNTYNGSIPPGPPGSWNVRGGDEITQCGTGAVGPVPFCAENTYLFSSNAAMQTVIAMTNQGDVPLELSVTSVTPSWATLNPGTITIPGRTMIQFVLTMEQAVLQAAQQVAAGGQLTTATVLSFQYPSSEGATQTYVSTQTIVVGPAQPPVVQYRDVTPPWFYAACVMFGILVTSLLIGATRNRRFILKFMRKHHLHAK